PAARGSTKATRRLLLHPAPRGRSVRGRHEIRSTAAPADALLLPPQPLPVAAEVAPAPLATLPRRSVPALPSKSLSNFLSNQPLHRSQQLIGRERLHHISIGALLLRPKLIALRTLGADQHHRNASELLVAFQFAAGLETIAAGHDDIHQDQIRSLDLDRLLQAHRIIDRDCPISRLAEHRLHQRDLCLRIIDNQYLRQKASLRRW